MNGTRENRSGPTTPARLRAPVKWVLAGTLLATAASLLWPTRELVPVQDRADGSPLTRPSAASAASDQRPAGVPAVALLPLSSRSIEKAAASSATATFDPFIGVVPPPPPAPPPVTQPVVIAPPPAPPVQDYRFLGRITGPDGTEQILLSRGDSPVAVSVGTTLDNGYVVESISADTLVLVFPSLGTKVPIAIGSNRNNP